MKKDRTRRQHKVIKINKEKQIAHVLAETGTRE